MDILNTIDEIVNDRSYAIWSITDLSWSNFNNDFSRAIIIAQPYDQPIYNESYDEENYHQIIRYLQTIIEEKTNRLKQLFNQKGIKNYIPPFAQSDERELLAPLPFKQAAVRAGLGWIGKSGVLITQEFGPRVRLGAILLDYPLVPGTPITTSMCGNCRACLDACPWSLINGVHWTPSSIRDELIDYQSCNKMRSEYITQTGRKHTCGYCLLACPWGVKTFPVNGCQGDGGIDSKGLA